jgi:hypothetical protein
MPSIQAVTDRQQGTGLIFRRVPPPPNHRAEARVAPDRRLAVTFGGRAWVNHALVTVCRTSKQDKQGRVPRERPDLCARWHALQAPQAFAPA